MIKWITMLLLGIIPLFPQSDFNLEDLNPNSESYGNIIGPADYLGDISIIFFGHEY